MQSRGRRLLAAMMVAAAMPAAQARAHDADHQIRMSPRSFAPGSEQRAARGQYAKGALRIGMRRTFATWDYDRQTNYLKDFVLRGYSKHLEVWVGDSADGISTGLGFPEGDCRNGTDAVQITDEQIARVIGEFESTVYPAETRVFGQLSRRDGKEALMPGFWPGAGIPEDAYVGDPNRVIALVDNIRDGDFYNPSPGARGTAGYVAMRFPLVYDRHLFVLDSAHWPQRLGPNPAPTFDVPGCDRVFRTPFDVEAVMAHEFNHTLIADRDPLESSWVSEGLAVWAEGHTYIDFKAPGRQNLHVNCFLGSLPLCAGGPENSLTRWGDPFHSPAPDYGAAGTFMAMLEARAGRRALTELHDDGRVQGLAALESVTDHLNLDGGPFGLIHDWSTAMLLDRSLDAGATLAGADPARFQVPMLNAEVTLDNPRAFAGEGVRGNGADFVRLRDGEGEPLSTSKIEEIRFDGPLSLPPRPTRWVQQDGALFVPATPSADDAIVQEVQLAAGGNPVLSFRTRHDLEPFYDFGVVRISTDGGRSYRTLPATTTTSRHEPDAVSGIVDVLPGFTGDSGGWLDQRVDLSIYAGQRVLIAFHYLGDGIVEGTGWWVDDVAVDGVALDEGAWRSPEAMEAVPVAGITLRLAGFTDDRSRAFFMEVPLDAQRDAVVTGAQLRALAGEGVQTVAAIVSHDDPTEQLTRHAPYRLTVDGVVQPGG